MILFGVRSPLVVDVEETLYRLNIAVTAAVSVNGVPRLLDRRRLIDLAEFAVPPGAPFIASAFAPARRRALIEQALELGLAMAPALIDPTAILPRSARIGDGSFINAGVVIGALSIIGEGVLVNRAASLGHHTVLGDFVSIGPGTTLAGNIHVGAGAMIGAGSTILPDVRIGANAIVSAGSVVRKHVADGAFVVGNPAVVKPFNVRRSALNFEDGE
jgi:sugar O-acyltransferase (sialic acid O-acetyltransferase NeuD family)